MYSRITLFPNEGFPDIHATETLDTIKQLGITTATAIKTARIFMIESNLSDDALTKIASELLADPISEQFTLGHAKAECQSEKTLFEVHLKPGVTDPVATSTLMGISDMNLTALNIRTARRYLISGDISDVDKATIAKRVLGNDCIEQVLIGNDMEIPSPNLKPYQLELKTITICKLDDDALTMLSKTHDFFLNLTEMQEIQKHYQALDREPTDIELETLAQTWSEHCVHKTLKSTVEFTDYSHDKNGKTTIIENLLKSTIAKATFDLDKPWCISVFVDNAGIVEFDENFGITFKAETHNHPSAIEPYGGAATGIGGCIRDTMGAGLAAKPIANTDVFCFASPDTALETLPSGVLHPRRVMKGVVGGVRDYGNRMGIPTVNGAVFFDDRYLGNPLVFCGSIGIIPKDACFGDPEEGNLIVVLGGRAGRDGIHGATFSSGSMTHETDTMFSHAVQIGNAITEKKVLDTLLKARDEKLYISCTDCGAGGLSSAVGEMGEKIGAIVELDTIPVKYEGLNYVEVWISEAQERMVIAVPPENIDRLIQIFTDEDVEATVIGKFGNEGKLTLNYNGTCVGELDMHFMHEGLPKYNRKAVWHAPDLSEPEPITKKDYTADLKNIFSTYNVASKEWIIRQYDHEVQGASVIKPLVGVKNDGPGDAAVIRPLLEKNQGLVIGCGLCPQFGDIDPYHMAACAIDEAIRNIIAVGGRADRVAILDNFCWGNCNDQQRMGALVKTSLACYDAAMAFGSPFISGKDSLNNEFITDEGVNINIPNTLLITSMTLVDDVETCITMDLKSPGNELWIVGITHNELGASHYYKTLGVLGANVPKVNLKTAPIIMAKMSDAICHGLVRSCHDLSEGGLAVAASEMAFAGELGIHIDLKTVPVSDGVTTDEQILFSESASRFLIEVTLDHVEALTKALNGLTVSKIGNINSSGKVIFTNKEGQDVISATNDALKESWQAPLRW